MAMMKYGAALNAISGGNRKLTIRGLDGNRVLLLEDGVALPRSFSVGAASSGRGAYADSDLYQRIEVLRGLDIEVAEGDMIVIPARKYHRFYLGEQKQIRCMRLFANHEGWTPLYRSA